MKDHLLTSLIKGKYSFPEPLGQYESIFTQSILGWNEGFKLFQWETKVKYIETFKVIFSRNSGLILTKLDTNHPYVKGIQVSSYIGSTLFPKGDNFSCKKLWWLTFYNPYGQFQGIQILQIKGASQFSKGRWCSFTCFPFEQNAGLITCFLLETGS